MNDRTWYEIKNSSSSSGNEDGAPAQTEVLLYGEIGGFGISAARFIAELGNVPKENRLLLRIHSPGGSVLDGNAIFTALRNWPGGVTTHIDGLAASMASIVAIAGNPVQIAGNGILMIHRVNAGAAGTPDDLRKMADTAEKIESTIVAAYVHKTGLSKRRITQMMDAETWMTAAEAEEMGFVDEITGDLAMAAKFDLSNFKNIPSAVAASLRDAPVDTPAADVTLKEELANAEARAAQLEIEDKAAKEIISHKTEEIVLLRENFGKLEANLEAANLTIEGFVSQVEKLEGEAKTSGEKIAKLEGEAKSTDQKAREIAARNGANLPTKDQQAGTSLVGGKSDKEMSRADFELQSPSYQRAFCRAGGKLTD